jgi:hypothetical protein
MMRAFFVPAKKENKQKKSKDFLRHALYIRKHTPPPVAAC